MPVDPDKREIRRMKAAIKKAGRKHRRGQLKRDLRESPETAHESREELGRYASEPLNGNDHDTTRKRESDESSE